jgi:hypothetical protein
MGRLTGRAHARAVVSGTGGWVDNLARWRFKGDARRGGAA